MTLGTLGTLGTEDYWLYGNYENVTIGTNMPLGTEVTYSMTYTRDLPILHSLLIL